MNKPAEVDVTKTDGKDEKVEKTEKVETPSEAQARFDRRYITSSEISERLGIERSTILYARRRGLLPDAIVIPGLRAFIWERETVESRLDAWKISLASRRGELLG